MSDWLDSPAWMRDAECHLEPGLPWTTDGDRVKKYEVHAMAAVCARCPVLTECRDYARQNPDLWGFWAGQTRPGTINRPGQERARPNDTDLILESQGVLAVATAPPQHGEPEALDDLRDSEPPEDANEVSDVPCMDELDVEVEPGPAEVPAAPVREWSVPTPEVLAVVPGWSQLLMAATPLDRPPVAFGSLVETAAQLNQAMAVYEHAVRFDGIGAASTTGARVGFLVAAEQLYRYAKDATEAIDGAHAAENRGAA